MDTRPLLKHVEDVKEIYDNIAKVKGDKFVSAMQFAGSAASLDGAIGFLAVKALGPGEQLDSIEHIVKEAMANLISMYFEAIGLDGTQVEEVLENVKMLQERAHSAARQSMN